mmetsp:Transcript_18716/g.40348  ORF Transcript_18716/g.40348 Transcript_18716/m.40348 type:complete len:394 (-) Transcript_18716:381-1562(-)
MSREKVVPAVATIAQQLKRVAFFQLLKYIGYVPHAPLSNLQIVLLGEALEKHPWRVIEESAKREHLGHPGLCDGVPLRGGLRFLGLLQQLEVLVPPGLHVHEEKMLGGLAGVGHALILVEGACEALHLSEQFQPALQHEIHPPPPGIISIMLQLLHSLPQSNQVPLGDIQRDNLIEQVIERLVTMGHQQDLLVLEIVVQQIHNLDGRIGLPGPRGPDDHGQARVHPGSDGLHLYLGEADGVEARGALRVGALVDPRVGGDREDLRPVLGFGLGGLLEIQDEGRAEIFVAVDGFYFREGCQEVVPVEEGVSPVELTNLGGHPEILGGAGISESQEEIVQPIGNRGVLAADQTPDRFQHRLEIVLLGLAPDDQVQTAVDVSSTAGHEIQILVVLS